MSRPSLSIDAATAYHEAGHAVVACCLGLRVRRATIAPDGDSAGHVMIEREKPSTCAAILRGELWHRSRLSLEKRVMQLQAGEVAQWQYNPRSVRLRHSQNDFNRCVELLRKYDPDQEKPDSKLHRMLLDKWTHSLIERHWHFVKAVANALLARRELSGTQLRDVIRAANQKQGARMPLPAKKKASRKG